MGSAITEELSTEEKLDAVLHACDRGDVRYLGEFIVTGGDLQNAIDAEGRNALHRCVKRPLDTLLPDSMNIFEPSDRAKCTRIMMKTHPDFLTRADDCGYTPLHLAVIYDDQNFIRTILEFNPGLRMRTITPNIEVSESTSSNGTVAGRTPIHLAVLNDRMDALTILLGTEDKGSIDVLDDQGAAALHYAVQLSNPERCIQSILSKGQSNVDIVDSHGRTALSWASTIGLVDAVELLLKMGAKLNVQDECGLTALHCAASRGHVDVVNSILSWIRTANMDDLSKMETFRDVLDKDGCSPLFYSVTLGHQGVTSSLIEAGARVDIVDTKGRTLAHCLARIPTVQTSEARGYTVINQMQELVPAGLEMWQPNHAGATPLHEACLLRNAIFVRELARLDGFRQAVNSRDTQGHTPLHLVVAASWSADAAGLELCSILLENGAMVNAETCLPHGGNVTALDLAIMNEVEESVHNGPIRQLLETYEAKTMHELDEIMRKEREKAEEQIVHQQSESAVSDQEEAVEDDPPEEIIIDQESSSDPAVMHMQESVRLLPRMVEKQTSTPITMTSRATSTSGVKPPSPKPPPPVQKTVKPRKNQTSHSTQTADNIITNSNSNSAPSNSNNNISTDRIVVHMPTSVPEKIPEVKESPKSALKSASKPSSRPSTNTSSASVRVDTPPSSSLARPVKKPKSKVATQQQQQQQQQQQKQRSRSEDRKSRPSEPKRNRSNHQTTPPYSQVLLERRLPAIIDRYMHRQEAQSSVLTGRHRMPRPTLSPYLIPLLPRENQTFALYRQQSQPSLGMRNENASHGNGSPAKRRQKAHPKHAPAVHNGKSPEHRRGNSHSATQSMPPGNSTKVRVQQSVADYEYFRLLQQLARMEGFQPTRQTVVAQRRTTKTATNGTRSRVNGNGGAQNRSAMGGRLSPVGRNEDYDDSVSTTQGVHSSKQTLSKRKDRQR